MASHSHKHIAEIRWSWMIIVIGRQLLLVPEAVLLMALICLHIALGGPLLTAVLSIGLIGWFACRATLIIASRRALNQAHYTRAERVLRLALWLYPFSADALALRGTLALAQGQVQQAEADFRRAIALYPGQAAIHAALSSVLLEVDRPAEARCEATRALLLDMGCASAYLHLANAEQQTGAPIDVVEAHLRMGLRAHPAPSDEAALRCTLATSLLNQDRQAEALLTLVGIEPLLIRCPAPQRAGLYYYLGELRRAVGDTETARTHFSASEALDPHGRFAAAAWRAARLP